MTSRKPEMKGILEDAPARSEGQKRAAAFKSAAAAALLFGAFSAFVTVVLNLGALVNSYPALRPFQSFLFPLVAIAFILGIIPLIFYLSFQDEFEHVNPLIPSHYIFLLRRSVAAIRSNDFKVSAKDF